MGLFWFWFCLLVLYVIWFKPKGWELAQAAIAVVLLAAMAKML
jgi:hypothetical protein